MTNTETDLTRHASSATELPKWVNHYASSASSATEIRFVSQMTRVAQGPISFFAKLSIPMTGPKQGLEGVKT